MLRTVAKMGLVLALVGCGGNQAAGPAPAPAEPVVARPAEPPAAEPPPEAPPAEAPVAEASSDTPAAATTTVDTSPNTMAAPPPPPPGGGTGKTAASLAAEAQTASKASQWGRALNLAEQSLRAQPDSSTKLAAMTIAALSACNLKNTAKAKQYFPQLPVSRQALIRQRCLANGVNVAP